MQNPNYEKEYELGCCGQCSKFLITWSNFFLCLAGIGLIVLGGYQLGKDESDWTGHAVYIALCALGTFVMLLSMCGWCSALNQNTCCLRSYSIVLLLLVIAQLGSAIYVIVKGVNAHSFLQQRWDDLSSSEQTEIAKDLNCYVDTVPPQDLFEDCYDKYYNDYKTYSHVVFGVAIGIVAYEICLLLLSCCLTRNIDVSKKEARESLVQQNNKNDQWPAYTHTAV